MSKRQTSDKYRPRDGASFVIISSSLMKSSCTTKERIVNPRIDTQIAFLLEI